MLDALLDALLGTIGSGGRGRFSSSGVKVKLSAELGVGGMTFSSPLREEREDWLSRGGRRDGVWGLNISKCRERTGMTRVKDVLIRISVPRWIVNSRLLVPAKKNCHA